MNVAQYVERGNALFPDRIALHFAGERFSYAQLNRDSNRWANCLTQLRIGRGDRIALWLPNTAAFIIAYLGIHQVGAVAVTINTALKAEEVDFILQDSGAQLLITTAALYTELAGERSATVQQVVIVEGEAGFQLLLHAYTKQRDLLIAAHVANRNDAAFGEIVGYLADTFPIRTQIPEGTTVAATLQQVQATLLAAMEHQGFPMRLLAERLAATPTDPTQTALCQVWFTLLPLRLFQESGALFQPGMGALQLGGLTLEGADLIPAWLGAWYDLELILTEGEEVVFGTLVYKADLFVEETVRRMIADLQICLQGMVTDPTQPVATIIDQLEEQQNR